MADPMSIFKQLLADAGEIEAYPTAMNLATVDPTTHMPRSRTVLLRRVTAENQLEFFTSYISPKAQEIEANAQACVCFFWPNLYHQVVIQGGIQKCPRDISVEYFESRDKPKQIASYTSDQSHPVSSYADYLKKYEANLALFENESVSCPEDWGGYHLTPARIEIWKGSQMRIHERHEYTLKDGDWHMQILQP